MSEIAILHDGNLRFESEWLESLNIRPNDRVEVNILDGTLIIKPV